VDASLLSALFAIGGALTGKLAKFASLRGHFDFIGHEDGQALLDWEVAGTARADEPLLVTGERGFTARIERTAELREEGIVHRGGSQFSVLSYQFSFRFCR